MDVSSLISRLEQFPRALAAVLGGLSKSDATWHPATGAWSIAEIVGHLVLEETDDFRARLASTIEDPSRRWPKLDPEAAVRTARFDDEDLGQLVARFETERAASLAWLRSLPSIEPARRYVLAPPPPLHAGDLLASWAAHDARHLEQIAKRLHGLAARDGAPYSVGYAG